MTSASDPDRDRFRDWPTPARYTVYGVAGVVLLLVLALIAAAIVVRRPLPQTTGDLRLDGLEDTVQVRRDGQGVPQIYAGTSHDLFYAQGFVQAQDRFWQMDYRRHLSAGRLSELFGARTVSSDMTARTLGWYRTAEREEQLLSAEAREALESYSDGVNAWLSSHSGSGASLEYTVLSVDVNYRPEPWTPVDSLAWLKSMAWDLAGNVGDEIARARLSVDRDPARAVGSGDGLGSNGWVVAGSHTTTGKPLLANDPHLDVRQPGAFYQMGLHCRTLDDSCPYDVSGFSWAGFPGIAVGHNDDIAWGMTNLPADTTDLYLEKVTGKDYLYDDRELPLEERDERIRIAGGDSTLITVRSTRHGPLVSDVSRELSSVGANAPAPTGAPDRGNGYAVAVDWTASSPGTSADALLAINRAGDWAAFRAAAADLGAPATSLVYADNLGNIGYQAAGAVPIRKAGHTGEYPAAGWKKSQDWSGKLVPATKLPTELNPASGVIVAANQAVTGPNYPYRLADWFDYGYRSNRIHRLLRAGLADGSKLRVADMAEIQNDTRNPMGPVLVPYLLDVLLPSAYYASGQQLLSGWDYTQPDDSAPAAYFNAVWRKVLELTFHDQLRESLWPDGSSRWMAVMTQLLQQPDSPWWDDVDTSDVVENRDVILGKAMQEARDELVQLQSRDPKRWTWGHLHQLRLDRPTFSNGSWMVRALFDRHGHGAPGGTGAVNATAWDPRAGYTVTNAPAMRMVVDLGDLDRSQWVNLAGQSGHAFDDHYTDQVDMWLDGRTAPWPFTADAVQRATDDTLVLKPGE